MSSTRVNDYKNGDCIQQPSYGTSGVPVSPANTRIKPTTGRKQGTEKRSRGSTGFGDCVQPPSSGTSGVPVAPINTTIKRAAAGNQGNRERPRGSTSFKDRVQQSSSGTSGVPVTPCNTTIKQSTRRNPGPREGSRGSTSFGDRVQPPSSGTSGVPVAPSNITIKRATGTNQGTRKRPRGSTSFKDRVQQPSSGTSGVLVAPCNTTIKRATGRKQGPREGSRGSTSFGDRVQPPSSDTSGVPVSPSNTTIKRATGTTQGTRKGSYGSTSSSKSHSKSSSSRTYKERVSSGTRLLPNLRNHPSVYARAGQNPPPKGLSFRGAWKNAVELYRAANVQYKQLFADAGFGDFFKIDHVELPVGYLVALTERWFAETNTVHLPCGEIGPTPVDWTMVTGLHFGGQPISIDPEYGEDKALELLGVRVEEKDFVGRRIRLRAIKPKKEEVAAAPPTNEVKERMFRRLFLYVIGGCFFGNNQSAIHLELVKLLEDINTVGSYDWGSFTFAAFLSGMRKKVTGGTGSFTAFWPFLLFWAFEYLTIFRPEHIEDVNIFPRALRWKFPQNGGSLDNSELTASRCQLDYVDEESKVTWQPYLYSEKYHSADMNTSITLARSRIPFTSFDTWEYYLGERCRRQLGLPCRVPSDPPKEMHEAHSVEPSSIVNSAEILVKSENLEYAPWFASNSIGKIVDVTRLIGGIDIGRKVLSDWMVKNGRGMILVPNSEVKAITRARDTADAERKKLQEELARVQRGSGS